MPASREARTGFWNAGPGGALRAAAALGGMALLLVVSIQVSIAAEAAPAKSAPVKSGPAPAGKTVTPTKAPVATTDASAGTRSATDSTVRLSPPAAKTVPAPGATVTPPAKGATPPAANASSGPASPAASSARAGRPSASRPATVPTVRAVSGTGSAARTAVSGGATTRGVQTVAHLDQKVTYQYNALGRRDPFQPMIGGEFVGADVGGDAPVDVGGMKVVGIVWGTEDRFAMVEDGRGQSMVLRVGDKVMNGVVEAMRRDAIVVRITTEGTTQSVTIPLTRKGDKANATR